MPNLVRNQNVALAIVRFLKHHNLFHDVRIYFNGVATDSAEEVIQDIYPSDYFSSANDESVCMSFEGPLYEVLNRKGSPGVAQAFRDLLEEYGFFYEMGDAWNLCLYEL